MPIFSESERVENEKFNYSDCLFVHRPLDNLSVEGLVRLWAHEALRLFQDRLVEDVERQWTDENIDTVAMRFFPGKYIYYDFIIM